MKIAIVADTYDNVNTGGTLSIRRLVRWLKDDGHTVRIVATGEPYEGKFAVPGFYLPLLKPAMIKTNFIFGVPDPYVLSKAFADVDVVHAAFPFKLGKGSVRYALKLGIPTVASFHVQPENILYNIKMERLRAVTALLYRENVRNFYNKADIVHCPSRFAAEELARHGCTSPLRVISNGIPREIVKGGKSGKKPGGSHFVVLTVGRHAREKNQSSLIEAVRQSKLRNRIQLVIAGTGPITDRLRREGKDLPIPPIIDFLPDAELAEWRHRADLYVHTSELELESMSCLEAIGTGIVPLIADSPLSAASQFALDERSLFPSKNTEILTRRIEYWLKNPGERKDAGDRYSELAEQFSFRRTAAETLEMYRECISISRERFAHIN
ncbi:MAG: glycosyltransferase [Spirochaetia bacterium]